MMQILVWLLNIIVLGLGLLALDLCCVLIAATDLCKNSSVDGAGRSRWFRLEPESVFSTRLSAPAPALGSGFKIYTVPVPTIY